MELFLLLLQIPLLIGIIRYIRKWHSNSLFVNSYYYLLSFKVTAGLFLGILYFNFYKGGDTITYFNILEHLNKIVYSDVKGYLNFLFFGEIPLGLKDYFQPGSHTRALIFIRIISPFYILSGSNYWLLSIYLSLFSFSGLWILSNTLLKYYKLKPLAVLISFFLFPSVVFWSAGIIKESLIMGIMGIIISILINLIHQKHMFSILKFLVLMIFSIILLQIKFYYFAAIFAVLIPYGFVKYFFNREGSILQTGKLTRILFLFL